MLLILMSYFASVSRFSLPNGGRGLDCCTSGMAVVVTKFPSVEGKSSGLIPNGGLLDICTSGMAVVVTTIPSVEGKSSGIIPNGGLRGGIIVLVALLG